MINTLDFFSKPGLMTSPGSQASLLDRMPSDIASLCKIVQGLMVHIFWAQEYGLQLSDERRAEVQLRSVDRMLDRACQLDPRPLTETREPDKRLVGNCRDFSVMLTTILRHHGVPARARCGFGRYFIPNHYEDHWVCEYWNTAEARWVMVDAQLDALQVGKLGIQFDPLDVPREEFVVGGKAWQMCRSGQADPDAFGFHDMRGLWFIRGDLGRDVASLNKMELLPWDCWGIVDRRDEDLAADDYAAMDQVASLTDDVVPDFDRVHHLYESDARWRVPGTIRSYTTDGIKTIELPIG